MDDLAALIDLNRDYITSVQTSDVRRFDEILADDFLCSNPDGSLVDRAGFLKQTAVPVKISGLQAHEVNVRPWETSRSFTRRRRTRVRTGAPAQVATPTYGRAATAAGWPSLPT